MFLSTIGRRIIQHLSTYGLRGQLERFLAGLSLYREMPVYVCEMDRAPIHPSRMLPVVISQLMPATLDEFLEATARVAPESIQAEAVRAAWLAGDQCFVARVSPASGLTGDAGEIAGWFWVAERTCRLAYLQQPLVLSPQEVYCRSAFTLPQFRGQGVLGQLFAHCFCHYRQQGRTRAYAVILNFNRSSRRATQRAGFRRLHVRGFYQLGPWRRDFVRPA